MALRKLFTDHAVYTKFVITDVLEDLKNTKPDLSRLLENQDEIGKFVGKIVGVSKGRALSSLLREHIQLAGACVITLHEGDTAALHTNIAHLFENSDRIGAFLHSLNPSKLPLKAVQKMFHQHNQYVLDIAIAQQKEQATKVVHLFDKYYDHMMMLSDTLESALS